MISLSWFRYDWLCEELKRDHWRRRYPCSASILYDADRLIPAMLYKPFRLACNIWKGLADQLQGHTVQPGMGVVLSGRRSWKRGSHPVWAHLVIDRRWNIIDHINLTMRTYPRQRKRFMFALLGLQVEGCGRWFEEKINMGELSQMWIFPRFLPEECECVDKAAVKGAAGSYENIDPLPIIMSTDIGCSWE